MIKKLLKKLKKIVKKNKFYKKYKTYKKLKKLEQEKKKKNIRNKNLKLKINTRQINYKLIWSLIFIAIIFLIIFINSKIFVVKKIDITRNDPESNITIAYNSINNFRWENIFYLDTNKIKQKLKNYQNNLKNIEITKIPPNTLKIKLYSFKKIFYTIINNKKFLVLANWSIIPINNIPKNLMELKIKNKNFWSFIEYKKILDKNYLNKILYIKEKLEKNLLTISIKNIEYYPIEREAHFNLKNNIKLIFDINQNKIWIDREIKKLLIFNKENYNLTKGWIIYIDLRIKWKIFYCEEKNKYYCKLNLKRIYEKNNK